MTQLHYYQYYFYYCHYNNSPNKENNSNPLFHEYLLCTRYHDNNFTTLYHIGTFCHNYHTYTSFSSQTSGYWCWNSSRQNPLCVGHTKANNVKHCLVSIVKGYKHFTYEHWMHFPLLPCTERIGPTMQSLKFYRKTLVIFNIISWRYWVTLIMKKHYIPPKLFFISLFFFIFHSLILISWLYSLWWCIFDLPWKLNYIFAGKRKV